jgi:predicted RNA-binding Zn-ribbon protein involved in translation (DUF1610 family)
MGKKLLHTTGCDEEGHVIHINQAERGGIYTCPLCRERIIVRNEGKAQRPHFAHFKKTESGCNGETLLFHLFRQKAAELLNERIHRKEAFPLHWSCPLCNRIYEKDMLQKVSSLATDFNIDGYHPDIMLLNEKGQPLFAIHLLFRRRLTQKTLHFYEEKGIILIQIQLEEDDWMRVEEKLSHPASITFCSNPECYNFQFYQHCIQREYYAQKFKCKKCGKVVDGYMVRNTSALGIIGLDRLRDHEKQEIVSKFFRGKRATVADILVYGKCRCVPHSKGLVCLNKTDDFKEKRESKITKKK